MENSYLPLLSFLGFGTLITDIIVGLLLLLFLVTFVTPKKSILSRLANFMGKNATTIALLVASFATVSSLFLSEIAGFAPCKLCWYQRIFMYPQVVILGVGLLMNDLKVRITALILSVIGFLIAIYHILVQFFPNSFRCSDEVANCALKQIMYFGYITIPVMSITAFALIIVVLLFSLRKTR